MIREWLRLLTGHLGGGSLSAALKGRLTDSRLDACSPDRSVRFLWPVIEFCSDWTGGSGVLIGPVGVPTAVRCWLGPEAIPAEPLLSSCSRACEGLLWLCGYRLPLPHRSGSDDDRSWGTASSTLRPLAWFVEPIAALRWDSAPILALSESISPPVSPVSTLSLPGNRGSVPLPGRSRDRRDSGRRRSPILVEDPSRRTRSARRDGDSEEYPMTPQVEFASQRFIERMRALVQASAPELLASALRLLTMFRLIQFLPPTFYHVQVGWSYCLRTTWAIVFGQREASGKRR